VAAKRALITGISGQDAAYLSALLLEKGYQVFGTVRRLSTPNLWRLQALDLLNKVRIIPADLTDMSALMEAVEISQPHEIYNLAAQSFVGASFETPISTCMVNGLAPLHLLEIVRRHTPATRLYQASTSELYGASAVKGARLNESSIFVPNSPYAAGKALSYHAMRIYRESYGLFAVNGILFNHESPLRGLEFVTRKVTNAVARISLGLQKDVFLGNLDASRDWGYAPEYVDAMWRMLQQKEPEDFVIATGETHTVEELCEVAFSRVGLPWKKHVKRDRRNLRPLEVDVLLGDPAKARRDLDWRPTTSFRGLIELMVDADVSRWQRHLKAELFPWDAPYFPDARYESRAIKH
jgi:GDPmannose 4,6-dehydratase